MQITVNGITYDVVVHENGSDTNRVEVFGTTGKKELVAFAEIDHDGECIDVSQNSGTEDQQDWWETNFPYYEYSDDKQLAEWMVATA